MNDVNYFTINDDRTLSCEAQVFDNLFMPCKRTSLE